MFKTGEFSKRSNIMARSLRYWQTEIEEELRSLGQKKDRIRLLLADEKTGVEQNEEL
jgi:hypothetical protein